MITATELERYLQEKIPLTVAMGLHVAECSVERVVLTAPLEPNRNHLRTAFGGSLHALATLSGYSLLWSLLDDPSAHIVIVESHISYLHPVRGEIRAVCASPTVSKAARFRREFARKGKARLTLEATIESDGKIAVQFSGQFAALGK